MKYWMLTVVLEKDSLPHTFSTEDHPADWLAKYGQRRGADNKPLPGLRAHLIFATEISKQQHDAIQDAGYQ